MRPVFLEICIDKHLFERKEVIAMIDLTVINGCDDCCESGCCGGGCC
jgi:hypothetical protein